MATIYYSKEFFGSGFETLSSLDTIWVIRVTYAKLAKNVYNI